jgi:C-terminal processing protease CtpA/Prc
LDRLTDQTYRQAGYQVRPQYDDIISLSELLAESNGVLDQWQIDLITAYRNELQTAYQSERGMTGPLPIDFGWSLDPSDTSSLSFTHLPVLGADGKPVGYDKPVIVLADDSSFSAAELFAASFQDSKRGPVVGFITGGLGGGREDTTTGIYSEAYTSVTVTRLLRAQPIANSNYPAAPFIENIGIIPDVTLDFMTADNLNTGGTAYVNSFTQTLTGLLPKSNLR